MNTTTSHVQIKPLNVSQADAYALVGDKAYFMILQRLFPNLVKPRYAGRSKLYRVKDLEYADALCQMRHGTLTPESAKGLEPDTGITPQSS